MLKEWDQDTIAAIATPSGEGSLGIIRLSGPEALVVADRVFIPKNGRTVLEQKNATVRYGRLVAGRGSVEETTLDEVMVLVMRGPKSYTGEDVVEISAHGGPANLQAVLAAVLRAGARPAQKGEFTKRAFLNGRIDLLQAEAVLDLVKAKTELGRRWAVAQLEGVLSEKMRALKTELLGVLSHLEASIDFPEDFPDAQSLPELALRLGEIENAVSKLLKTAEAGELCKKGLRLVIAGRPNVGKSSLMNRLARANRVIVTPYPGTTRDVVEEEIQLRGFPVRLVDTAGIQDTSHPIEKEGIERTKCAVRDADLVLYVLDGSREWHREDEELLAGLDGKKVIVAVNKEDLPQKLHAAFLRERLGPVSAVGSSCITEEGTRALEERIHSFISGGHPVFEDQAVVTTTRQRDLLEKTRNHAANAGRACLEGLSPELVAVDVRLALDSLGLLVGEAVTDDLLEVLFSQFCIGK